MLVPLERPDFSVRFASIETKLENEADDLCYQYTTKLKGLMRELLPKLEKWDKEHARLATWAIHKAKTSKEREAIALAASKLFKEIDGMGWSYRYCPLQLQKIYDVACEIYHSKSMHSWRHGNDWKAILEVCKYFKESVYRIKEQCEAMQKSGYYSMLVGSTYTNLVKSSLNEL